MPAITPEIEARIRELWQQGACRDDICRACGLKVEAFLKTRKQLALPPRALKTNSGRRGVDPSPREIRSLCKTIRAGWGPTEYAERAGYPALKGDARETPRGHRFVSIPEIVDAWEG